MESLFLLDSQGQLRDVLLGHNGSAPAIRANAYWKGCFLAPFANRIANATYTFMNTTYHLPINEPSRHDALHGFLCNKTTSVVSQRVDVEFAELVLSYLFDGIDPGYPFLLNLSITYRLTITSGLDLSVTAKRHPFAFHLRLAPVLSRCGYEQSGNSLRQVRLEPRADGSGRASQRLLNSHGTNPN